ncbi:hypothetical protein FCOIX_8547 [Fusarium coicis]|nr:hypothetical protein FCOIX_8547 [Fusarium coicis]
MSLVLFISGRFVYPHVEPSIRVRVMHFKYSKIKLGGTGFAITGLQISSLILFLAANGLLLGVGISDLAELEQRAAAIASANLMLVFLGGRTNVLADWVQIPLSIYYVGHRWIGVVATCEALLHSALALFRHKKFDALTKSGYVCGVVQTRHHRRSLGSVFPDSRLRLDGPYGKDLKLHTFETVVLTAKGLGISGVLPFALHLAARKRHDNGLRDKSARLRDSSEPVFGDLSRHVDLIWWLEHDDQDRWVHDQLQSLQEVDNKVRLTSFSVNRMLIAKKFLVVWCIYPVKRNPERKLPFTANEYWSRRYNFGFDDFSRELRQEARYPGRTVVVASGEEKFVSMMRDMVVQNTTSKRLIEFADVEYHTQPGGFKSSFNNLPDSQALLVNSTTPPNSQSTPIEMTEMDISDQHASKVKEFV